MPDADGAAQRARGLLQGLQADPRRSDLVRSLHFLPLAYESSRHPGYEETRIRCRASNPYGIIVSRVISVKPG